MRVNRVARCHSRSRHCFRMRSNSPRRGYRHALHKTITTAVILPITSHSPADPSLAWLESAAGRLR